MTSRAAAGPSGDRVLDVGVLLERAEVDDVAREVDAAAPPSCRRSAARDDGKSLRSITSNRPASPSRADSHSPGARSAVPAGAVRVSRHVPACGVAERELAAPSSPGSRQSEPARKALIGGADAGADGGLVERGRGEQQRHGGGQRRLGAEPGDARVRLGDARDLKRRQRVVDERHGHAQATARQLRDHGVGHAQRGAGDLLAGRAPA